ncbi:hypothetical protein [Lacimicrobium sp. SS2-24]|uniref:hypothetical protein n=1 Tax=Lacimicrobium sp. SS2-24 TaxID=2005569 RepID=UPI000B4C0083|nr:hypothetical protein [Lacimicrobium sp. SS2-24]
MTAMQKQSLSYLLPALLAAVTMVSPPTSAASGCPERFHAIPLTTDAKFCQQFDDKLPASLSFFSAGTPELTLDYYLSQMTAAQHSNSKGRQVLQSQQGHWVIVISQDGEGSQVDILVKANNP